MARAKSAGDATREPFTYILLAAVVYLAITSVSLLVLRYFERRYSVGVKAMEI
ncbi:Histidine transport system permease protein HisQ [compost metagenome]